VTPGDTHALAGAIRYLGRDPDLRLEMGRRNRVRAETALEWSQATRRYLSIYEALGRRVPTRSLAPEATAGAL
jgi:glycosyltransferase involved in cell wall biosynthesis